MDPANAAEAVRGELDLEEGADMVWSSPRLPTST
jgi:delta-aminolevulinic acid dehydratase/porphobilinogen synthase